MEWMGEGPVRTRVRRSKSVENIARQLERVGRGEVVDLTAEQMAPVLERAMKNDLAPHRRTGLAEATARAVPGPGSITLENRRYVRYIKGVVWGRRIPSNFFSQIRKRLAANARALIRGAS